MKLKNLFPLVAVAGVIWLLAGCSKNPEPALRQRVVAFTQLLMDDKFEPAVDYFDPDVVSRKGRTPIADVLKLIMTAAKNAAKASGREPAGFAVRTVNFYADKSEATAHLVFFSTDAKGGDRRETPSDQRWVLKNKMWYVTQ